MQDRLSHSNEAITNAEFLIDIQDLFSMRRFGHVGQWRYSPPIFDGDKVNGLNLMLGVMSERKAKNSDYYIYADEVAIIRDTVDELNAHIPHNTTLIDLGPGGCDSVRNKVGCVLNAWKTKVKAYVGVDINQDILNKAASTFDRHYSNIPVQTLHQDFFADTLNLPFEGYRVAMIFGQTLFNLPVNPLFAGVGEKMTTQMLGQLRRNLRVGEVLMVTQDCNADSDEIVSAYAEEKAVWLNMLHRIKRDLLVDGNFDVEGFDFEPLWITETKALSHTYVVKKQMSFEIGGKHFNLNEGDRFYLHNSYKFSLDDFKTIAHDAGFEFTHTAINDKNRMALHMLKAV
jgi:uncharacterized SAM-dependent methyltransferase